MVNNDERNETAATSYEGEIERLAFECNRLAGEIEKLKEELLIARSTIEQQKSEVDYLEGQVKAFEFCISKGRFCK